ncbi:hypothetical protein K7X08_016915 [Anisodus acutangulus]|uniref:Macro domain-containing protein n=1 Tax=Anisodus acutangulus TaxID=402998 RepID=A0A9Q1LTJ5_9SOLA|nr:hypothetical protein K7X08_016915 [Anisodus acutangulus]
MLGGGDGELRDACYKVPEVCCPTGEARITPGFSLPASHVIHTVGPIYDANPNCKASLTNAYRNIMWGVRVSYMNNHAFQISRNLELILVMVTSQS